MAQRSRRASKRNVRSKKNTRILKVTQKAAMTAGSLSALALAPAAANAAVVNVNVSPVSLPMTAADMATATWDVDAADGDDFQLWKGGGKIFMASMTLTASSLLNGRGFVGPADYGFDDVQALQRSFSVGPTLASSYNWGIAPTAGRNAMNTYGTLFPGGPTYFIGYDFYDGFGIGDNFIGFRFEDGNDALHYGWANINFDTTNGVVTITNWAYESTPDTAIHIPNPAVIPLPGAHALGLLGLGAAGLMRWRQRRKEQATADA